MKSYQTVLAVTILAALFLSALVPLLKATDAAALISALVVLVAVADVAATAYILRLVLSDHREPRSWLLLMLLTTSTFITVGVLGIGFIVSLRFLGNPPLPNSVGLLITGMSLLLMGAVPVTKATLFYLVRRDRNAAVEAVEKAA